LCAAEHGVFGEAGSMAPEVVAAPRLWMGIGGILV
jgi:hypothetical protein